MGYYKSNNWKEEKVVIDLRCGDCLEVMKSLPDNSVDIIITSPPYNLGKTHHTGSYSFNAYDTYIDDVSENEYQINQIAVLQECFRILKDTGSMWYNHKNRIRGGEQITPYQWILKTDFIVKREIVWVNGSQNFDKCRFYPFTERLYWLSKQPTTKLYNILNHGDVFSKNEWSSQGTNNTHKRAFPLQMPLDILRCFPDAKVVMDIYMGSGTTGVACKALGRDFIGVELDENYFDIAKRRIENSTQYLI